MAEKKKTKPGRFRRFLRSKKAKLIIIGLIICAIPSTALGAYQAQQTWSAMKKNDQRVNTAVKHPISSLNGWLGYHLENLQGRKGAKHSDFVKENYLQPKAAARKSAWGTRKKMYQLGALAYMKKHHPAAYNRVKKATKNAKPGTVKGEKKIESAIDKNNPNYKKKTQAANSKENSKEAAEFSSNSTNGESSFKSKIAAALLHIFWSTGLGKWIMQNGAAGTVFTYNTLDAGNWGKLEDAQVASQLADKVNNSPMLLMFPASSYNAKLSKAIDAMQPPMMAFAAIMLVVATIVAGTQLGIGSTFNAAQGRLQAYRRITDVVISVAAISCIPMFVRMLLQIDGAFLEVFANYMESIPVGNGNLMQVALRLGADDAAIKALTQGKWLGSGFAAIIFVIIYLMTSIGLAIWVKYFYFARMIAFIILMILGPVFIAMWPFGIGKSRTMNWLRDVVGTIFIQPIHAFVLTLMATLMAINSDTFGSLVTSGSQSAKDKGKQIVSAMNASNSDSEVAKYAAMLNSDKTMTVASNFEMMVMGFIVLILFQPVSKSIAELLGIGTNMLENIRSSTSRTLTTGAAIAGTAALGIGAGALRGAAGLGHGLAAGADAAKAKKLKNGLKNTKKGSRMYNLRQSMAKQAGAKAGEQWRRAMRDRARAKGLMGPNAGRLMGAGIGAGTGSVWAMTGLSAAGGEIGKRAAALNQTGLGLVGLGLKRANAWRKQDAAAKDLDSGSDRRLGEAARSKIDNSPGPKGEITDRVNNNSKLSSSDKQAALQNVSNYQQALGSFTPNGDIQNSRVQMEQAKDESGNYVSNAAVQTNTKGVLDNFNKDYANVLQSTPQNYEELQDKAKKVGFDLASWDAKHPNGSFANRAERIAAANTAMNSLHSNIVNASQEAAGIGGAATTDIQTPVSTNELNQAAHQAKQDYDARVAEQFSSPQEFAQYQQTPRYRSGLQEAQTRAKEQAYIQSNGGVVSHQDMSTNTAFNNSVIDGDRYNRDFGQRLDNLSVSSGLKRKLMQVPSDLAGQRMVGYVDMGHGNTARAINQELFDKMNKQRAYTLRSQGIKKNGRPINASDLAEIYNNPQGLTTPQQFQDYYNKQNQQFYSQDVAYQKDWRDLRNLTNQAAESGIGGAYQGLATNILGNAGYGGYRSRSSTDFASSPEFSSPFADETSGGALNMQDVRQMVPINKNERGEPVGVSEGAIRVLYNNNYSMLQARDQNGEYHQVGNLGPGEGSLGPNEIAYQDADLTPTGDLVMRTDPNTHRPAPPYRLSEGSHIPVSLPNGSVDLGQFFNNTRSSTDHSDAMSKSPYATSAYMGMPNAMPMERAYEENNGRVYGDQYDGYTKLAVRGTYDGMVMTGVDPADGQRKVMSRMYDNSIWDNMTNGYEFNLPIERSSGEYKIDTSGDRSMEVQATMGNTTDPTRLDNLQQEFSSICRSNQDSIQKTINEVVLQPTKPVSRSFIGQHGALLSLSALDFKNKVKDNQ